MTKRTWILAGLLAAVAAIAAVLALRGGDAKPSSPSARSGGGSSLSTDGGVRPVRDRGPFRRASRAAAWDAGAMPDTTVPVDDALVAGRPPTFETRGRHAWRLDDVLGDVYWAPQKEVHVHTADGRDFVVRGSGKEGDDVILVERDDGSRYVGWLAAGADPDGDLGDIERPAERLEDVLHITVEDQPQAEQRGAASVEVVIEGAVVRTLVATELATIASATFPSKDRGTEPALDLSRDLGASLELVGFIAEGAQVTATPPAAGARPVLRVNRRLRFKLAWLDGSGEPIGAGHRDVTRVELRRR